MKKIIITLSLATVLFGQLSFTSHTITTNADYATSVFAIDMDNDGRTYSYNGTQDYITGTGVIATLEFLAGNAGEYDINFLETTTLRKANNDPIDIEEKVEGVVKID